jgi:hypothetical protein
MPPPKPRLSLTNAADPRATRRPKRLRAVILATDNGPSSFYTLN